MWKKIIALSVIILTFDAQGMSTLVARLKAARIHATRTLTKQRPLYRIAQRTLIHYVRKAEEEDRGYSIWREKEPQLVAEGHLKDARLLGKVTLKSSYELPQIPGTSQSHLYIAAVRFPYPVGEHYMDHECRNLGGVHYADDRSTYLRFENKDDLKSIVNKCRLGQKLLLSGDTCYGEFCDTTHFITFSHNKPLLASIKRDEKPHKPFRIDLYAMKLVKPKA